MCGIFAYFGPNDAKYEVLTGLKNLEYRGYDSWGIAVNINKKIKIFKKPGHIGNKKEIEKLFTSNIAIGHTRWATHGGVTKTNAHPHLSTDKSFVLAQNGIVENYLELKNSLIKKGYKFISQTDTEVIVRLIEDKLKQTNKLISAVLNAFKLLKGRNTIIILTKNNEIIAVKNGSPLVAGTCKNEFFLGSDLLSFMNKAEKFYMMNDSEMLIYKNNKINLINTKTGKLKKLIFSNIDQKSEKIDKEGFDHFMIKEIIEQKDTVKRPTLYSLNELKPLLTQIKKSSKIIVTGAGTASFAAAQIAHTLRTIGKIDAFDIPSYEITSYKNMLNKNTLLIAVSQSGETADTLEAVDICKKHGMKIASFVNMLCSTLSNISDFQYYSRSGPEICVASTKAFTTQVAFGYLLSYSLIGKYNFVKKEFENFSNNLNKYFNKTQIGKIKFLVKKIAKDEHFFILGRGDNFHIAREGALKIKEITYKHFEAFSAGELKHGVIALVEKNTPVFAIIDKDEFEKDMISAICEVKARGAYVVGIGESPRKEYDFYLKTAKTNTFKPIANVIPFQLLSYYLALKLGNPPDKPRNLAKSVTVK